MRYIKLLTYLLTYFFWGRKEVKCEKISDYFLHNALDIIFEKRHEHWLNAVEIKISVIPVPILYGKL